MYLTVSSSSRRRPLFPPLPEDPVPDSSLHGSDIISRDSSSSDSDSEKSAKRRRMLKHAESYLRGEPLYLHSARIRGPVIKNPWGKSARQVKRRASGGELEGVGKKLKRWSSMGEEEENGREIMATPSQAKKSNGVLTSRGTNTINDIPTPTPLRTRPPEATNVPDRSPSRSPAPRRDLPFEKQTEDEAFMATLFKTPVKKKSKPPVVVAPAFSPGTFYSRPTKSPQTLTTASKPAPHTASKSSTSSRRRSLGTRKSPPQETQGSNSKSRSSISSRKNTGEEMLDTIAVTRSKSSASSRKNTEDEILDTIAVATPIPPFPDIDVKKKRPKVDFAAKSPFVKPASNRTKLHRERKKKNSTNQEKKPKASEPQPDPVREANVAESEYGVGSVEAINGDTVNEQVLENWVNIHVAASQSFHVLDDAANPLNEKLVTYSTPPAGAVNAPTSVPDTPSVTNASSLVPDTPSITARTAGTIEKEVLPPVEGASLPADLITPKETAPPHPHATVKPPPPPGSEMAHSSATINVPRSPDHPAQPPETSGEAPEEQLSPTQFDHSRPQPSQTQADSWQNTQYQLLAAQKGFFDAIQESPVVFGPYLTSTAITPGRDLLRPTSFFDNNSSSTPYLIPSFGRDPESSPFKTPGMQSVQWTAEERAGSITPFMPTFESGESPPGTAFTPFRAFATPESSPKASQREFSPLTFSPLKTGQCPSTKKSVKFSGGFGLLDDDEEETLSDGEFSPLKLREMGQQGGSEEGLVEEVMEFMGGGVWDIDEELRKMAGATSKVKGPERGRGNSVKKRRLYTKR